MNYEFTKNIPLYMKYKDLSTSLKSGTHNSKDLLENYFPLLWMSISNFNYKVIKKR